MSQSTKEEHFVNVWFSEASTDTHSKQAAFYREWANQGNPSSIHSFISNCCFQDLQSIQVQKSACTSSSFIVNHTNSLHSSTDALRKVYPNHSLVLSTDYALNIFADPTVVAKPLDDIPLLTSTVFVPLSRMGSQLPGLLQDAVRFGGFSIAWQGNEFLAYIVEVSNYDAPCLYLYPSSIPEALLSPGHLSSCTMVPKILSVCFSWQMANGETSCILKSGSLTKVSGARIPNSIPRFRKPTGTMSFSRTNSRRIFRRMSMVFSHPRSYTRSLLFHGRCVIHTQIAANRPRFIAWFNHVGPTRSASPSSLYLFF